VNIYEFAKRLVKYFGDGRSKVIITGLRPGEKLYEELWTEQEALLPTHHPKIRIAEVEKINSTELLTKIENLLGNLYYLSDEGVVDYCKELVPEFNKNDVRAFKLAGKDNDFDAPTESQEDYFKHSFKTA